MSDAIRKQESKPVMPVGFKASIPNVITCVVVASGCMLMMSASFDVYRPWNGLLIVAMGLIADIADGMAARWLNVGTKFGSFFDELADLTAFGIGPAVFFVRYCMQTGGAYLTPLAGYTYMLASVYRISRELVVHRGHRPLFFVGVTTNMASGILITFVWSFEHAFWLPGLVVVLAVAMVVPFKMPKDPTGLFISFEEQFSSIADANKLEAHERSLASSQDGKPVMPEGFLANIPNLITAVVIASGSVLMVSASLPGYSPKVGVVAVFVGLIADIGDGMAARALKVGTKFGAYFDELADLTAFGIGPAVFFMRHCMESGGPLLTTVSGYSYMLASVYRISRELVVHRGSRPLFFVGITTNMASGILVSCVYFFEHMSWLPWLVLLLALSMVVPIKMPKDPTGCFISFEEQFKSMAESEHADDTKVR